MTEQNITNLKELQLLHKQYLAMDAQLEDLSKPIKSLKEELDKIELKILRFLEDSGMDKFSGEYGEMSIRVRTSFRKPETQEQQDEFLKWCESRGINNLVRAIDSANYNSFMKGEMEAALLEGRIDWQPPGTPPVHISKNVSIKGKKK